MSFRGICVHVGRHGALGLLLLMLMANMAFVYAANVPPSEGLTQCETILFAREFSNEPLINRLERIEMVLYGDMQTGSPQDRLQQVLATLSEQLKGIPQVSPDETSTPSAAQQQQSEEVTESQQAPSPDVTDYPTVTEMERKLFQKAYATEDITQRLNRLEKTVFQQTFEQLPMVDRVDQLTLKILPHNALTVEEQLTTPTQAQDTHQTRKHKKADNQVTTQLPSSSQELTTGDLAIYGQLSSLEQRLLGRTYGGELILNRLTRLENTLFGTSKSGDAKTRLLAIQAEARRQSQAAQGQGQSPYGSNRAWSSGGGSQAVGIGQVKLPPNSAYPGFNPPQQQMPYAVGSGGAQNAAPYSGLGGSIMQSVASLEQRVYGRTAEQLNLVQRVGNLEQTLFGQSFPQFNIQYRVNQLIRNLQQQPMMPNNAPPKTGLPQAMAVPDGVTQFPQPTVPQEMQKKSWFHRLWPGNTGTKPLTVPANNINTSDSSSSLSVPTAAPANVGGSW